jgi:hypothetical protein
MAWRASIGGWTILHRDKRDEAGRAHSPSKTLRRRGPIHGNSATVSSNSHQTSKSTEEREKHYGVVKRKVRKETANVEISGAGTSGTSYFERHYPGANCGHLDHIR